MIMLTVGIPTQNSIHYIKETIKSIESLQYPKKKMKLIFVDDHSTDGTFEILQEWKADVENQYHEVFLIQERSNIPQARNLCIKHFEGKYLLFWDSDVLPPKNLLRQMIAVLESNSKIGIVGADYSYENRSARMRILGAPVTNKATHAVYMGFTLIRKEVFERVGVFNELLDVGEDTEFCIRVAEKTNYKIMWASETVLHLKHAEETKRYRENFLGWLSYNFYVRGKQYGDSFHKLPLLLKLRISYYVLMPLVLLSSLLLVHYTGVVWMPLMFLVYLLPGLFLAVWASNIRKGTMSFFISNVPTGVALSYGVVVCAVKKVFRKIVTHKGAHGNSG